MLVINKIKILHDIISMKKLLGKLPWNTFSLLFLYSYLKDWNNYSMGSGCVKYYHFLLFYQELVDNIMIVIVF